MADDLGSVSPHPGTPEGGWIGTGCGISTFGKTMGEVIALALKDVRLLVRDRAGLAVTFVFPLVYALFFGVIFSNRVGLSASLNVCLVDEDRSALSQALTARLASARELTATQSDRAGAIDTVRRGRSTAYILIPAGFEAARLRDPSKASVALEVGIDPARRAVVGMIEGILTKYGLALAQRQSDHRAGSPPPTNAATGLAENEGETAANGTAFDAINHGGTGQTDQPGFAIEIQDVGRLLPGGGNAYAVAFPQGIIWGVLGCTAAFGISFVTERTRGTMVRLRAAPLGRARIMAGKAGACFITTVALAVSLFAVAVIGFGVRPQSYPLLVLAIASMAVAFVGIMMLLSVLGKTEQAASGITWAGLLAMAMLGGAMVPHFYMPTWLQLLSEYSPVRWAILVMDAAIWRGFTFTEMIRPCAVLLLVGVLSFLAGAFALRWVDRT